VRKVRIIGGPSPRDVSILVDGEPPEDVLGFRIEGDVTKAVRFTSIRYAEADIELNAEVDPPEWLCVVRTPETEAGVIKAWREVSRGSGPTLMVALAMAGLHLPEKAS
jgi:hypothetical protein